MKEPLYTISLDTEMDVVLAQQKTLRLCEVVGCTTLVQTQMGTAVSEIARNTLEHAQQGRIRYYVVAEDHHKAFVEIVISDTGPGLNATGLSVADAKHFPEKGHGISRSQKLVDHFHIDSSTQGTTITLQKTIPGRVKVNDALVRQSREALSAVEQGSQSPYEALKAKNRQLITLMQQLEEKNNVNRQQVDEIQGLNEELNRKNQDLTEFAYTLSHDLKNPLSNIMVLTDLAKKTEDKTLFLEKIATSAHVIDDIVRGLMQIVDVDQDVSTQIKTLNFQEIIDRLAAEYLPGGAADTHIRTDLREERIHYVEPYLNSILRNLISNAVKYQAEERPLQLTIATRRQDDYVVLSVADNGIGMDLTRHESNLFKPFRRFTQQRTGKGIGLHLIKKMIEKNGGRIEVTSTVGQGTTFHCYLKRYDE